MTMHNNNQPLVSIIMNCYNGETYLRESINSVLEQTYENWELIFWDNRSEDQSAEIFKSYKDQRLKYYYAPKHTTLYAARNEAIKNISGEFIAFLDTDDFWVKDKLELPYRKTGSAALDMAYVAAGRYDGYFQYDLNLWDIAAGIIIVKEAGGILNEIDLSINENIKIIASSADINSKLLQKLDNF